MHIHILGICGTFMGGLAVLAKQQGHEVSGSDANVYPPMSTQLEEQGIHLMEGYELSHLKPAPDCVIIGNAMSRGNPLVEYVLAEGLPYQSGPQWLAENILQDRWVLAVAGTHGKTTTSSMLAWILEYAGLKPGFLIGGVPLDFGVSARLGEAPFFVIEADEYDSAFFDKRSKFIHYHARTQIINNLEFDHADIFDDLKAIQKQFHNLVRTIPGNGLIVAPKEDSALEVVFEQGCWTPIERIDLESNDLGWFVQDMKDDGSEFAVCFDGKERGRVKWDLLGEHNVKNALSAISAARHAGVAPEHSSDALSAFNNVKRRMEVKGKVKGVTVYDDFAHHPTAIETTLAGLRARVGNERIIAVLEFGSYTMKQGTHAHRILPSLREANHIVLSKPAKGDLDFGDKENMNGASLSLQENVEGIIAELLQFAQPNDHILIMSNKGFEGIHDRLLGALEAV